MTKIQFDPHARNFSTSGESYEATVTFAEKEEATNTWKLIWGHLQTWFFGGGPIQNIISAVKAQNLLDRCKSEHWSPSKCVAEVRKAATEQKKSTRVITSVVGAVASLEGGIYGAAMAAGAGAGGGAIVGIAAATMLVVLLLTCLYGWTVGAWISKRGFVRIIESKLNKELMKDVD
jgi:hypothetical protein